MTILASFHSPFVHLFMLYFLYRSYCPNTAASNRALAYLNSLDFLEQEVTVMFLLPDKDKSKIQCNFQFVNIVYCWDHYFINHNLLKYISYFLYICAFIWKLKKGDKIYIYGYEDLLNIALIRKNIEVYYEKTECPEINLDGSHIYRPSINKHIKMCKRVKGLFVISSQLEKYYIEKGVLQSNIHIINMIVDEYRFNNLRKEPKHEKYVAYCGTASNNKDGVDNLIRAFSYVLDKIPDIKLYIIGDVPDEKEYCENMELIRELGIRNIEFIGRQPAEKMPQLLKNAEVLALARPDNVQAKYGFPTKLGEYLLTGNPVVVTAVGDIPLFLRDGANALISPPNEPRSFADKMIWALEHPLESKKIGEEGKIVALTSFNALYETQKMMKIMNS